jgi:hypothetical protein
MIPKTIHYCWFGRKPLPPLALKCIASWKRFLPEYELKEWNESNFDVNMTIYTKEAYEVKKYAFVTDYVRLWAIYNYGGIYMDTDVEVIKPLNEEFLQYPAFSGFESDKIILTGIMASEKNGQWAKEQLYYYEDRHFVLPDRSMDLTTNTSIISKSMSRDGFILDNSKQNFRGIIEIFPKEYFCPDVLYFDEARAMEQTYTIHYRAGSWCSPTHRTKKSFVRFIAKIKPLRELYVKFYRGLKNNG